MPPREKKAAAANSLLAIRHCRRLRHEACCPVWEFSALQVLALLAIGLPPGAPAESGLKISGAPLKSGIQRRCAVATILPAIQSPDSQMHNQTEPLELCGVRLPLTLAAGLLVAVMLLGGCQGNRQPNRFNPMNMFGESRIPAPATFSYQVPGQVPSNNGYYNPNAQANLPLAPGNASQPAAPGGNNPNLNWQTQPGFNAASVNPGFQPGLVNSLPNQPTYTAPPGYPSNYATLASSTATIQNTDFRTTSVNEATDPSRMVASDANRTAGSRAIPLLRRTGRAATAE